MLVNLTLTVTKSPVSYPLLTKLEASLTYRICPTVSFAKANKLDY